MGQFEVEREHEAWRRLDWIQQSEILLDSYEYWIRSSLLPRSGNRLSDAETLYYSANIVVSHGTQADPVLNYGNQAALQLWEMTVDEFCRTPSRMTAEPVHRDERARLLARTSLDGFVDDYSGIRISSTGKRFLIHQATVWNLRSPTGEYLGQAAMFNRWEYLASEVIC